VCFCDEAIPQTGSLNRYNSHYWSPVNSHWFRERINQHRWNLHVRVGILNGQIIGLHFIERMINGEIVPLVARGRSQLMRPINIDWWQKGIPWMIDYSTREVSSWKREARLPGNREFGGKLRGAWIFKRRKIVITKLRHFCKLLRVGLKVVFLKHGLLISRECACYSRLSDDSSSQTQQYIWIF